MDLVLTELFVGQKQFGHLAHGKNLLVTGHGIGLALISYTALKLSTGKAKEVSALTYILSVIFIVKSVTTVLSGQIRLL